MFIAFDEIPYYVCTFIIIIELILKYNGIKSKITEIWLYLYLKMIN